MMRLFFFIFASFLLPSSSFALEFESYFEIYSFTHSEPISIKAISDDWDDKFYGGDTALSYNRMEVGVSFGSWKIGALYRNDYQFHFSPGTAELKYLAENRLPLVSGRTYPLIINANNFSAKGIKLSHKRSFWNELIAEVSFSYLEGISFTNGTISGNATALSESDYDIAFDVNYFYSRDVLFDRVVTKPGGTGYAVDISLNWHPTKRTSLNLDLIDLLGKMYWENAPFTVATANSNTKQFDKDGYVIYNPLVSGIESKKNFTQRLPRKLFLNARYKYSDNIIFLAEYQDFGVKTFYSPGIAWKNKPDTEFEILFNVPADAIELRYRTKQFSFGLTSDEIDLEHARTFGLQIMYKLSL